MALTNDMAVAQAPKLALSQHWWFRLLLLVGALFIPPITEVRFASADTSKLIAAVLSHPLIVEVSALLPLAKVLLLLALLCAFRWRQAAPQILLGYYVVALVVTGVLQNMGHTDVFGFAWLTGNTFIMLVLAVQCAWEVLQLRATPEPFVLPHRRLWVLVPMAAAFLMPYQLDRLETVRPYLGFGVLTNEAGLTYCMITPVIIGALVLFARQVSSATLSLVSFVGLYFGIVNLLTWWVLNPQDWWMGVLHLPLVILASYGLVVAHTEQRRSTYLQTQTQGSGK
jgi:hypothetical protein